MIAAGPYRFVRNPMCLATLLCLLSFAILLNRLGFWMMVMGTTAFTYCLILREEAGLTAAYGESYGSYRDAVPRWLPTMHPARLPRGGAANWRDGLLGGAYLWLLAGSLVVLAAGLKESWFYATLVAGFVVKLISIRLAKWLVGSRACRGRAIRSGRSEAGPEAKRFHPATLRISGSPGPRWGPALLRW